MLYERFLLASEGTFISHPLRSTTDDEVCLFPGILKGELVLDCSDLDGTLKCPTRDGSWKECKPFDPSAVAVTIDTSSPVVRYTTEGEKCTLPAAYNGKTVFDCIALNGDPKPRCLVEGTTGTWKVCQDRIVRYTISGQLCAFPFTSEGNTHNDCVEIDGTEQCQVSGGSDMEECAPKEASQETQGLPSERPPPIVLSGGRIVSRVTTDGDKCIFPFWHQGKSVAQCIDIGEAQQCQVASGELKECAEMVFTKTGTPCAFPFTDSSMSTEAITACVEKNGKDMCKNAEGNWEECGGTQAAENHAPFLLPGRTTVDQEQCAFPFWYKGRLVSSCVDQTGSTSIASGSCQGEDGQFALCSPVRTTVTGNQCSMPFVYEGKTQYDCLELDGSERCMVVDGQFEECAPKTSSGTDELPAVRSTMTGAQCVLPFVYNGETQYDCVEIDGVENCKNPDNEWDACSPRNTIRYVERESIDGDKCSIPFDVDGRIYTDCVALDGKDVCLVGEEDLVECAPLTGAPVYNEIELETHDASVTESGVPCRFPFTYNGALYDACVDVGGVANCKVKFTF